MKRIIFVLVFCCCSWLNQAVAASSDQFEFGSISGPCVDSSCVIKFKNNYTDPLVFLMASYANDHWNDAPSTLRVISVKNGSEGNARIRQYFAPYNHQDLTLVSPGLCNGKNWCLTKQPMENISYFVIENGADINLGSKGRIIARSVTTNKYIRYAQQPSPSNSDYIETSNLVGEGKIHEYGVIVESQAVKSIDKQLPPNGVFEYQIINKHYFDIFDDYYNYTSYWYTPLVDKKKNGFYLSLDRGETVINKYYDGFYNNDDQKVGYLLVKGFGQYKGLLFSLGHGETPNTLGNNNKYKGFGNVTVPPQQQCKDLVSVPNSNKFKDKPLIIASKNSRNGSDGGIFRLCRQTVKKPYEVSFVTDEDLNELHKGRENEACGGQDCIERRHANESYGFMAFQQAVSAETCELFPGPVQSWDKSSGSLLIDGNSEIENALLVNKNRYLGFPINNITGTNLYQGCDGSICLPLIKLMPSKINISDIPESNKNIIIRSDVSWLNGTNYKDVRFEGGQKLTLYSGNYYFNSLLIGNNAQVIIPAGQNVKIYTHYFNMSDNSEFKSKEMTANGDLSAVVFVKNGGKKPSDMQSFVDLNKSEFKGYLYTEGLVHLSNTSEVEGSVTAKNVQLHNSEIEGDLDGCFFPTPKYTLTLSPDITSTLCDSKKITFSVNSTNSDTYNGTVSFTLTSASSGEWSTTEDFTSGVTKFNSGSHTYKINIKNNHATIWLRSDGIATVNINASIENNTVTATGQYQFSMTDDVYFSMTNKQENIIAGKTFNTVLTAKICGVGNKAKTLTQYSGPKILDLKTDYIQPTTPAFDLSKTPIKVEVITGSATRATDYVDIKFDKGVSSKLTLKYREAGVIKWQVTDPNYTFEKIQSSGKKRRLTKSISINGVLGINSRPWTFAICPLTFNGKNEYDNASGTSKGGEAYTAAGHSFDILLKPLVWQKDLTRVLDVSNQDYCSASVTKNFLVAGSPALGAGVISQYSIHSPANGDKGIFHLGSVTKEPILNGLLVKGNTWSEVGSLWLQVRFNNYLGMNIDQSKRHIGRFFPAYFGLTHNQLTPAMTSFTYMGQPFPVHWTVNAFNQQGKALDNYDQFAETLTAKFGFVVKNNNGGDDQRLLLQDPVPEKWSHNTENSHSYINYQSNVTYARKGFLSTPLITSPDGPDELWQLWLNLLNPSDNRPIDSPRLLTSELCSSKDGCTNPTVQKVISLRIGNQNPMRYGRMALQDAAGDIGKPLTIPLRVEYWNGAEFVTNSDDSASTFDGANYCRQILIQEPAPHMPNNPTTSGAGKVNLGQSLFSQLMANPDGDFKQQIRFWQRLSAFTKPTQITNTPKIYCKDSVSNQPWLSFNWRGIGDEDPSATVTFGVYHGNNRIIYRGETNDAGQSIPYLNYQ
ncbi:hypothetical protein HPQ32_08280 [Photobacterium carnosum]|uniref:DUF6701 domain-containing protein n=1 Tax=Photobacterium carnosum TaxID=2023717 RepID=UPI001C90D51B|nr:DUF6701 domain-containing protein [Photobacterium carnosum]MBY3788436.1 hypothetical protein [Photobacterium carnosum]MCD9533602.1 hypothetical protein [Photobacterium carnosum]